MKPIIKIISFVLIVVVFLSCSKSPIATNRPVVPPPPPPPSLSGQEFLFDSLTWIFFDGRFDVGIDDIYLKTPLRPDLFPWLTYSKSINAQVSLKFDTASNWVEVESIDHYSPALPVQYLYWIYFNALYVNMFPLNYQLIDRKAAIKIKYL